MRLKIIITIATSGVDVVQGVDTNCTRADYTRLIALDSNETGNCFALPNGATWMSDCLTNVSERCATSLNDAASLYIDNVCDVYYPPQFYVCMAMSAGIAVASHSPVHGSPRRACSAADSAAVSTLNMAALIDCSDNVVIGGMSCFDQAVSVSDECEACLSGLAIGPAITCASLCEDIDTQRECGECVNAGFMHAMATCSFSSSATGLVGLSSTVVALLTFAAFLAT